MPGTVLRVWSDEGTSAALTVAATGCAAGSRLVACSAAWLDNTGGGSPAPSAVSSAPALPLAEDARGGFAQVGVGSQGVQVAVWSAHLAAGGDYTITANYDGTVYGRLVVLEVGGLVSAAALDRTANNSAAGGADMTPTAGPTAALAQADEWMLGVLGATGGASSADVSADLSAGWTRAFYEGNPDPYCATAVDWRNAASTAGAAADWGTVAIHVDGWSAALATYKATGGAPVGAAVQVAGGTASLAVSALGGAVSLGAAGSTPPPAPTPAPAAQVLPGIPHARGLRVASGASLLGAAPPNAVPQSDPLEPVYAGAVEVFYDQFDGNALDRKKWLEVYEGEAGGFVHEAAALSVANGLRIRTSYRDGRWRSGGIRQGTSAQRFAGFLYGQVSVKARVAAGRGYGPAFLLWPVANGGERTGGVDVLFSPSATKLTGRNAVRGNPPDTVKDEAEFAADLTRWRVHTARWEPDRVTFYLDGTALRTVTGVTAQQALALALQGFVAQEGDALYGGAPNDFADKLIEVAYVRVSQLPGGPSPSPGTPTLSLLPSSPGTLTEQSTGAGATFRFTVNSTGVSAIRSTVVQGTAGNAWRHDPVSVSTGGSVVVEPTFLASGDFLRVMDAADASRYVDSGPVTLILAQPPSGVFFEDFNSPTGTGQLTHNWGDTGAIQNNGDGTITLHGSASGVGVMTFPGGVSTNFGHGLFEIRAKMTGGLGSGSGPALVLWPASDVWPGPEIDIGEINWNGVLYMAMHWRGDDGRDYAHIREAPAGLDWTAWHVYGGFLQQNKVTFYVDGAVIGEVTTDVVPDYAHGGENRTIGFMNRSAETTVTVDWCRWTPEASVGGGGNGPGGGGGSYPASPHLRLTSAHGAAVVESQDGTQASVRLVRPVYPGTPIVDISIHNTGALPSKAPYWGYNPGWLTVQNGRLAVVRELLSTDDGTIGTDIYQELNDGSYIQLPVALSVAPNATGAVPGPTPVPAVDSRVWTETFDDPRRGTGALYVTYANVGNSGLGTVVIQGIGSANQPFSPTYTNDGTLGFPNGLFEFRSRYIGADIGDGSGPCQLLWPSDDRWPGSEIDLGELMGPGSDPATGGGVFYCAIHWAKDGNIGVGGDGNDGEALFAARDNPEIAPGGVFDHTQWHTYGALLQNDRVVLYIDGKVLADFPTTTARDFRNGGVNHSFGILCGSNGRGIEVDWCRWTPEAMVPDATAGGSTLRNGRLREETTGPVAA